MPVHLREIKLTKEEKERYPDFQGIIILIYSDAYFDLFYERHCKQQKSNSTKTILVIGEGETPDKELIRNLFVKGVLEVKLKPGELYIPLQAPFAARQWSGIKKDFIDLGPKQGFLRVQDCGTVSYLSLGKLCRMQIVDKNDIKTIRTIQANAGKHKLLIKFVWFFGHIDVTFSNR